MSLFDSYESELASLQADLVRRINGVPELSGDEKQREINLVEKAIDDANELVRLPRLRVCARPAMSELSWPRES